MMIAGAHAKSETNRIRHRSKRLKRIKRHLLDSVYDTTCFWEEFAIAAAYSRFLLS